MTWLGLGETEGSEPDRGYHNKLLKDLSKLRPVFLSLGVEV